MALNEDSLAHWAELSRHRRRAGHEPEDRKRSLVGHRGRRSCTEQACPSARAGSDGQSSRVSHLGHRALLSASRMLCDERQLVRWAVASALCRWALARASCIAAPASSFCLYRRLAGGGNDGNTCPKTGASTTRVREKRCSLNAQPLCGEPRLGLERSFKKRSAAPSKRSLPKMLSAGFGTAAPCLLTKGRGNTSTQLFCTPPEGSPVYVHLMGLAIVPL